jgi:hypothetical protein
MKVFLVDALLLTVLVAGVICLVAAPVNLVLLPVGIGLIIIWRWLGKVFRRSSENPETAQEEPSD